MAKQISVRLDMSKLLEIEKGLPGAAERIIQKIAQDVEGDIKRNFSPQSPSAPGDPPGVDTGMLKNSIVARSDGKLRWVVADGVWYGVHLEYGTQRIAARPFFLPAVERVAARLPRDLLKEVTK